MAASGAPTAPRYPFTGGAAMVAAGVVFAAMWYGIRLLPLPDLSFTAPTTPLLASIAAPLTSSSPLGNPASHQPEIPLIADGYGPVNKPTGGALPAGSGPASTRMPSPAASGEPGMLNNMVIGQVTVTVKLLTAELVPAVVCTHT